MAQRGCGIRRDLLIDSVPPAAIRDWRYMAASVLAGLLIFIWRGGMLRDVLVAEVPAATDDTDLESI